MYLGLCGRNKEDIWITKGVRLQLKEKKNGKRFQRPAIVERRSVIAKDI